MTVEEIKKKVKGEEYNFLRENAHLNDNIVLLCLGGSHAYGTSNDNSDIDIRGIALNSREEILLGNDFEQVTDVPTDTTVYSFKKIIKLLSECNPNTIEELGCRKDHYLYLSPVGEKIIQNKNLFLSQKAIHTFGGYANQQLYRLMQKSKNSMTQVELEKHIKRTLEGMMVSFQDKYTSFRNDGINLYVDKSPRDDYDTEIYMDVKLTHYPLRDYAALWGEMMNTVKAYKKVGKRNQHAIEHNKISKHMMHLVRLYLMCFDILEKGEINTYREKEHDFLMEVRNGKFVDSDNQVRPEFFELVKELEKHLDYAKENTFLPPLPDYKKINEFVMYVNAEVVKKEAILCFQ